MTGTAGDGSGLSVDTLRVDVRITDVEPVTSLIAATCDLVNAVELRCPDVVPDVPEALARVQAALLILGQYEHA